MSTGNYSATSNNMKLVHWPLMGELLHLVQRGGDWVGLQPAQALLAVPNVTAHPSTASVPITVLLYNGPLLCSFNAPVKGLNNRVKMTRVYRVGQKLDGDMQHFWRWHAPFLSSPLVSGTDCHLTLRHCLHSRDASRLNCLHEAIPIAPAASDFPFRLLVDAVTHVFSVFRVCKVP